MDFQYRQIFVESFSRAANKILSLERNSVNTEPFIDNKDEIVDICSILTEICRKKRDNDGIAAMAIVVATRNAQSHNNSIWPDNKQLMNAANKLIEWLQILEFLKQTSPIIMYNEKLLLISLTYHLRLLDMNNNLKDRIVELSTNIEKEPLEVKSISEKQEEIEVKSISETQKEHIEVNIKLREERMKSFVMPEFVVKGTFNYLKQDSFWSKNMKDKRLIVLDGIFAYKFATFIGWNGTSTFILFDGEEKKYGCSNKRLIGVLRNN